MRTVTFLVLEGVDKGRVYRDLPIPVTIGREEGNLLRLNDERVSRFHAKIQAEDSDIILTDLESTNGTRVNGAPVQIRRLRPGDQVSIGRTMLLFGTMDEIENRRDSGRNRQVPQDSAIQTIRAQDLAAAAGRAKAEAYEQTEPTEVPTPVDWSARDEEIPPLPLKLSGAQAARFSEIFDFLHRGLSNAVENIEANEDGTEVKLGFAEWQTIQAVQMLLARYGRGISEPNEAL